MSDAVRKRATMESGDHRPRRRWCDIRWITAGAVVGTIVFVAWGLFGPEPAIRVSRETTYITEPLAADGLPDYPAALLALAGPAPPPDENAAAAILQACWPMGIEAGDLPTVCVALGIPNDPPADPLRRPFEDAATNVPGDMFFQGVEYQWSGAELPELEAWLIKNQITINKVVTATRLPRYWLPSPRLLSPGTSGTGSSPVVMLRDVCQILLCRANWHIGERRYDNAWQDIHAVYRLSRLLMTAAHGLSEVPYATMSAAIEGALYLNVTRDFIVRPDMPSELLSIIRKDLDALGPLPASAATVVGNRLLDVESVIFMARRIPGGRTARASRPGASAAAVIPLLLRTSLDWNLILKQLIEDYDHIDAIARLPSLVQQRAELQKRVDEQALRFSEWESGNHVPGYILNRQFRTRVVGFNLWGWQAWTFEQWLRSLMRAQAQFELTRTTAALEAWRRDDRDDDLPYPDLLEALVPQYLPAVPIDPFSDKPLIYERRGDGYLLASVGENGVFDGGDDESGWIVDGEWQKEEHGVPPETSDLVVRMPAPDRPFVTPSAP